MKIRVCDLIVRFLERLDVKVIFGMPGAHILPVYDCLYQSSIKTVLAKHEQGASFMACGYARVDNGIAACITTAGPGATNLITGIANAYADRQPVLIITGETSTHIFGKGGLQESSGEGGAIDQCELFKGITRYSRVIERTDYLLNVLRRAVRELKSDRPGPVLLSLPFNVQLEEVDDSILDQIRFSPETNPCSSATTGVSASADLIEQSQHPVIIAGYGCIRSNSQPLVEKICNALNIPATSSLKGKGALAETSELSLGSLGVTSYGPAFRYIDEHADLVILLGAGFNERTSYTWNNELFKGKKIIQVDIDYDQLEKVFSADLAIQSDIHVYLKALIQELEVRGAERKSFNFVMQKIEEGTKSEDATQFRERFPLVEKLFNKLTSSISEPVQVFDDNIIFAQNFLRVSAGSAYYPNSGISSLGHAIPAAIGARMASDLPTFVIIGDGGFQMCCMEIMTAVNYGIPLTIIMYNNSTMGLIRKNQFQKYDQRYIDCDFINPDYAQLSASFGINYYPVHDEKQLDQAFSELDYKTQINLIDFYIDKDAFPNYVTNR